MLWFRGFAFTIEGKHFLQLAETRVVGQMTSSISLAANDQKPISGLTHRFYRYPARFSPAFARACIQSYSKPGDVVLDPYMGGGTTMLEAMVLGRMPIGCDISSLAVFVTQAKTECLSVSERSAAKQWATEV